MFVNGSGKLVCVVGCSTTEQYVCYQLEAAPFLCAGFSWQQECCEGAAIRARIPRSTGRCNESLWTRSVEEQTAAAAFGVVGKAATMGRLFFASQLVPETSGPTLRHIVFFDYRCLQCVLIFGHYLDSFTFISCFDNVNLDYFVSQSLLLLLSYPEWITVTR